MTEMFEVNGIDDFYDKNALITYEINGHEIPVHMKPHFTPQTKSMFPEYAKDSPAEMAGFVRQGGGGTSNNHKQRHGMKMHGYIKQVNSLKLPLAGLTINDMPEYKMQRFTGKTAENSGNMWKSLEGMKEDKVNGAINSGFRQNKALERLFQKQLPVISILKKMHSQNTPQAANRMNAKSNEGGQDALAAAVQSLKYHVPRSQGYPKKPVVAGTFIRHQYQLQNEQPIHKVEERNPELLQQFMASRNTHESTVKLDGKYTQEHPSIINHFVDGKPRGSPPQVSELEQEQNREESAHFKTGIAKKPMATDRYTENQLAANEENQATTLFKNLDSLHKKLQIDKQINQAEQHATIHGASPQKGQAKTRILNLLGELTEKLKGMESIVTKHQNKEVAEKFMKTQEREGEENNETVDAGHTNSKVIDESVNNVLESSKATASSNNEQEVEAMNRLGSQITEKVSNLQQGLDEGLRNADSRSYRENPTAIGTSAEGGINNRLLVNNFKQIGEDDNLSGESSKRIEDNGESRIESGKASKGDFLVNSFMKIGGENPSSDREIDNPHFEGENGEFVGENSVSIDSPRNHQDLGIVQRFHSKLLQQNNHNGENEQMNPLIMNTKSIDYKPSSSLNGYGNDGNDGNEGEVNNANEVSSEVSPYKINSFSREEATDTDAEEITKNSPTIEKKKKFFGKEDDDDDENDISDADDGSDVGVTHNAAVRKHWKKPEVDEDPMPSRQTLMEYNRHHRNNHSNKIEGDSENQEDKAASFATAVPADNVGFNNERKMKSLTSRRHKQHGARRHHKQPQHLRKNNGSNDGSEEQEDEETDEDERTENLIKPSHHHKRHHGHRMTKQHGSKSASTSSLEDQDILAAVTEEDDAEGANLDESSKAAQQLSTEADSSTIDQDVTDVHGANINKHRHLHNKLSPEIEEEEVVDGKENAKMFEVEESLSEAADVKNNIARHRSFKPKSLGECDLLPLTINYFNSQWLKIYNSKRSSL